MDDKVRRGTEDTQRWPPRVDDKVRKKGQGIHKGWPSRWMIR